MNEVNRNDYERPGRACSLRGALCCGAIGIMSRLFNKMIKAQVGKYADRGKWRVPKGFTLEKIDLGAAHAEMLVPDGAAEGRVILLLHGGAYVFGLNNLYRRSARILSRLCGNVRVLFPDYRLAPQNPFPAALEDALSAYRWILDNGYSPENVIFIGDSAGGGLALAASMALRDRGEALPGALVLLSPWTDLAAEGKSHIEKLDVDPLFGRRAKGGIVSVVAYTTLDNLKNPYVSPAYGNFEGLPPMLIHAGEREVLLSDSETVAEKAKAAGVPVDFHVFGGMFHVFQMLYGVIPEAKRSVDMICSFMKSHFGLG